MSTNPAISAIEARIVELMRERTALSEQVRVIATDIHTLETAARIMDGQRTGVRSVKPRATNESTKLSLERGAFTRGVLEVLRDAGSPLTVMETGQAVLTRLGLPEDAMARSKLSTKVMTAATSHVLKGTLRRIEREGEPFRLEVAR